MATLGADSRVQLYGENQHDDCGYCGSGPVVSYGIRVQKMATSHYQGLMDRGWRRSGTYFYKPTMHQTCCPQYTIRLECSRFQMSKSQRAVLKTMARYLHHGSTKAQSQTNATRKRSKSQERKEELPEEHQQDIDRLQASVLAAARGYLDSLQPAVSVDDAVLSRSKVIHNRGGVHGDYSSNIAIVLASHFKRESQMEVTPTEVADAITSRLSCEPFEILSQRGFLNFTSKDKQPSSEAKDASDSAVVDESRHSHKRKLSQPSENSAAAVVVAEQQQSENQGHVLTIETTPAVSTPERFDLYSKYQQAVHDDKPEEVTNQGFTRFLANSPLYDASKPGENPNISSIVRVQSDGHSIEVVPCDASGNVGQTIEETLVPEGSYHQLYRLDGKLIAIGVVDVTANTLSSVYCIYDPDYRELMLGKFCALMEIQWVTRHTPRLSQMQYYYMGYYIHSCQKMRYKGEYRPSELLCPQSFSWQPLADCIPIFERYRFSPLRPDLAEARARIPEDTGPRSTKPPQESSTSSSDDASASVEQENGDKNDGDQPTEQSPLDAFAPEVANKEEIAQSLRLDIGAGFLLTLQQLMPDSQVQCVSWNCSGQYLGSGSSDKTLRVWIVDGAGTTRPLQNISTASVVEQICWHPSVPNRFATISGEEDLKLWDTRTNRPSASVKTGGGNINLAWSADGRHIAVGNREDNVTVFDVTKAPKPLKRMKFPYEVNEFAWSASGDHLMFTTGASEPGGTIQVVEFDRTAGFGESVSFPAHTSNCFCMKTHFPTNRMVVGSADSLVSMWDLDDMSCLYTVPRYEGAAKGLSFSNDGSLVAAIVEGSGAVDVFAAENGESVTTIETTAQAVNAVAWIPQDDKKLLAVALDTPVRASGPGGSSSRPLRHQQDDEYSLFIAVLNR